MTKMQKTQNVKPCVHLPARPAASFLPLQLGMWPHPPILSKTYKYYSALHHLMS